MLHARPSRRVLACSLLSILSTATAACVYASDAPTPNSSGETVTTNQDGTDPGSSGADPNTSQGSSSCATSDDGDGGTAAPTWDEIYPRYFAASGLGRCGSVGCHFSSRDGFECGADKDTCYQGLVSAGYIDTTNGAQSAIADTSQTPLSWYGHGGNMPGGGGANAKAADDITAWVQAGAQNDSRSVKGPCAFMSRSRSIQRWAR
jgi:hypothetical protein